MKILPLLEVFSSPYSYNQVVDDNDYKEYRFSTDEGHRVDVVISGNARDQWTFTFDRSKSEDDASYDNVTGWGDAYRIFSTIISIMGDFVEDVEPSAVSFTAAKGQGDDSSREKLYDRMISNMASRMGYRLSKKGQLAFNSGVRYVLQRVKS